MFFPEKIVFIKLMNNKGIKPHDFLYGIYFIEKKIKGKEDIPVIGSLFCSFFFLWLFILFSIKQGKTIKPAFTNST
jgi:hypothetical protein